ncbi:MAG: DUF3426 domain-containing protein [Pseudomonadota bacterium]|nr:DUF3426 domain-containing protein [Pseudomonadota bacterium]
MIIQCPACNTSFSVKPESFGARSRKVKCSRCSFIWTSSPSGKAINIPSLFEPATSQGIPNDKQSERGIPDKGPDHPLPVPVKKQDKEKPNIFLWLVIVLAFLLISSIWIKRDDIVNEFPNAANILKVLDPSINIKGIEISDLKSRIDYAKGNASLVVTGTLVNQNTTKRAVPNIVVVIEDSKELVLAQKILNFGNQTFNYLERKDFKLRFNNYPEEASNIVVELRP